jgi:hypothetical protein
MKRTFATLCAAVAAAIVAAVLGTGSADALATPLAALATIDLQRSGTSPAMPVLVAADQTSSPAPILVVLPPTVVTDPTVVVGPMIPTPESRAIARKEAAAVLSQAKRDCHRKVGSEQKSCLGAAQDDYRSQMVDARYGNH